MHREHVVAVHLHRRQAQALGARRGALARRHRAAGRGGAPAVVLADEQHRQAVHLGPIERFEERAAVDRAVAEEAHRDRVALLQLLCVRRADRDGQARRHHAVRAEHADREICDVHGPALAAVEAGGLAEQLAHHAAHVCALGQRVAVAAVRGGQVVVGAEMDADTGRHGLLTRGEMERPAHLGGGARRTAVGADAALARDFCRVLEGPDTGHRPIQPRGQLRPFEHVNVPTTVVLTFYWRGLRSPASNRTG